MARNSGSKPTHFNAHSSSFQTGIRTTTGNTGRQAASGAGTSASVGVFSDQSAIGRGLKAGKPQLDETGGGRSRGRSRPFTTGGSASEIASANTAAMGVADED